MPARVAEKLTDGMRSILQENDDGTYEFSALMWFDTR